MWQLGLTPLLLRAARPRAAGAAAASSPLVARGQGRAASSGSGGWSNLSFAQKMIYSSALLNVCVIGFVWLKRQLKMSEKEAKEMEASKTFEADMDMGSWSESNQFRCFFAAQRYHMLGTASADEEKSPEVQKMLEVMAQCREELYRKLPIETPAMRPLHMPPQ
eukprot:CAMPEP_0183433740 /NCGR_PEP_ID=MMETSP0370-20130417/61584_1 /TAXON_ID=268820 /ORGANISM="Peridinium aciculiferum, Strain PAER-2" /LENGTH=163 /DNA_ID=CAMNT_0025620149 /DNA_START=56 /DNA_END=547 /DNA_ORIENTATION=+